MGRIGIFGGTFNPPHIGHIHAAEHAITALALDVLLIIPAYISPHKALPETSASPEQRLEMLKLATAGMEKTEISDIELRRGGISYTYETVAELKAQHPEDELIFFMGTDMFLSFENWRFPEKILEKVSLGVFYRGDKDEKDAVAKQKERLERLGATVYLTENPIMEISSTDLRRMLVFRCAESLLPQGVNAYIQTHNLYGTAEQYNNLTMEQLEQTVVSLLKPGRVPHVLGCRDTAIELAKLWGADETHAARAALLHDVTKALNGGLQLTLCQQYDIILDKFSTENRKTLHALTGSVVAERIFGESKEVVEAIRFHTTGKADMTTLQKIIYVADYVEPNRGFPGVEQLRNLAYTNLDRALKLGLEMTLSLLKEQKREISPASEQALAYLMQAGV